MNSKKMRALWPVGLAAVLVASLILAAPAAGKGKPAPEGAGNNLSYPVIWAEGVQKALRGDPGMEPLTIGAWWYWWGIEGEDPNDTVILSCAPDPDDPAFCDDGVAGTFGPAPPDGPALVKAYLQKDPLNVWQAGTVTPDPDPDNGGLLDVVVDWIDWGDNLESVDWYTRSQVRTEVVLFKDLAEPMLEYEMRHVDGWGISEVHGLATTLAGVPILGLGNKATVYSTCARLTIQKLLVDRGDSDLAGLEWFPEVGWIGPGLINEPIFNKVVYEAGDGPGYYNAEINVKGRIIYGYTWNVRKLNDGAGDYRITFSFDETCGIVDLNTFFLEGTTKILLPVEEVVVTESDGTGGGGIAVIDYPNNLTYMDIRILERSGGGGKKKK